MSDIGKHFIDRLVTAATIQDIQEVILNGKTKIVFLLAVQRKDGESYRIMKGYKDFFDLQCSILDAFPLESGQSGYERIIPYLPGQILFI